MPDLERDLKNFQNNRSYKDFPSEQNYYNLYVNAKDWLSNNILNKNEIKVAYDGEGFYTDHSISHCNAIIKIANKFLDFVYGNKLSAYETYLFLISTLIHDAGMIYGRKDHGANCRKVGEKMHNLLPSNSFERSTIYKIASAHQGRTINNTKDTLNTLQKNDSINNIQFRPSLIASLIRLFDEISEDHTRSYSYFLENDIIPEESKIHHAYAYSIRSVNYISNGIEIIYCLNKKNLKEKYILVQEGCRESIYIFDWICRKFAKINNERQYCSSYMWGFLQIEHVVAKIQILDDDLNDLKTITIRGANNFILDNIETHNIIIENDYSGDKLQKEFFSHEQ